MILNKNCIIATFRCDHSDHVCNWIPTRIIYSLTYPETGICALILFHFLSHQIRFTNRISTWLLVSDPSHGIRKFMQLSTQCILNRRMDFLYAVPMSVAVLRGFMCQSIVVWATVPDHHFGSGSRSKPKRWQIGGPGHQSTRTPHSGTVPWCTPNPSELGGLSAGCPAGPSIDSHKAGVFAVC